MVRFQVHEAPGVTTFMEMENGTAVARERAGGGDGELLSDGCSFGLGKCKNAGDGGW